MVSERGARDRRPTMSDVAARVGVSRALVSLVFRNEPGASDETREKVFAAARELGYRPDSAAQMLARSRSKVLGVMLTVRNLFHADLVEGIYPVAERLGYEILLSGAAPPARDERKAVDALLGHRCEGLILLGGHLDTDYVTELGKRIPAVVVGRRFPGAEVDSVHVAEGKGVRQIIDYLVDLGHTSIVHIDGGDEAGSAERRRAYLSGMRRHGLAEHIRVLPGGHTEESGANAAQALLADRDRLPTAVFASNDRSAVGFLDTVWRAGLDVPGDVSVVGYDDNHLARLSHIDLTTVRQDPERQAELAVRAVVERLDEPRMRPRELVLQPSLVIRGSTGVPKH
ncbi:LacI family DNA-binding transcriptional regulator [Amycolatopsis sp.]|uniref:LacI family DNA-binding transcriptional regulator n=1 Tax=Amycolatopsis sp. TaxID=37632 RepID=UPI002B9FCC17|nr:LacI family DNA-binding transcriptional regulator [Amycolatopsis sp.]HVV12995.1 LacI family DNA-binding transcriptional regulator [Amycolatopsis sp.]